MTPISDVAKRIILTILVGCVGTGLCGFAVGEMFDNPVWSSLTVAVGCFLTYIAYRVVDE
tara:strand:- start:25183 stop:25362 length:180 start_codon:yes stop_codon:yes gene_type:complete